MTPSEVSNLHLLAYYCANVVPICRGDKIMFGSAEYRSEVNPLVGTPRLP